MICLGIETSCDETALALAQDGNLLDSVLASQADLHAIFGGVVPELASREHYRFIGPLFDELMRRNNIEAKNLNAITVTRGPGLLGSLLVGSAFAKALALTLNIPLVGVNHLHAHLLACGIGKTMVFPALGLLVSGGHTHIYKIDAPEKFSLLGRTLDDAAGEAFDKIGHMLGMDYPAGKHIDELARNGKAENKLLPRPYLDNDNLDFSFSGLKTAAFQIINKKFPDKHYSDNDLKNFCASLNLAIAETLAIKVKRALKKYPECQSVWLAGGVAANSMVRDSISALALDAGKAFMAPELKHCTDNAAMIAFAGSLLTQKGARHDLALEVIPRGRKIPNDIVFLNDGYFAL